ncbi:WD40/YVTN repeat-like domain-containing protein [Rhizobium phage RHph_I42]|nr:WD40/YVTN repeat-like domain-containing protein [Rhizobium phage RHph_I42]
MTIQFSEQTINGTVSGTVRDFAISPDGTLLLACTSVDTYLLKWNTSTKQWDIVTISGKAGAEPGTAPGFSYDNTYLFFQKNANLDQSGSNAYVRWQLVSGVWTETRNLAAATRMKAFKGLPNDQMLALYYDQMYIWTIASGGGGTNIGPFFTGASAQVPNDGALSPDTNHLAITRRNNGVLVYRRTPGTDTWNADTVNGGGSGAGNWRVQWIDNTHFLMSESEVANGLYLGTLTATNTWTITAVDTTFNSVASFVLDDGKTVGYYNSSAAAAPKVWDFSTGTMVSTTDFTGLPTNQTMVAARSRQTNGGNKTLALAPSTGGMRVFAMLNSATVPIVYSKFGIAATGDAQDGALGSLSYQKYTTSGNLNVPVGITGAYSFGGFKIAGLAGAFDPEYPETQPWHWKGVVGVENQAITFSEEVPTEPWLYSDLVYSKFAMDSNVSVIAYGNGALNYQKFETTAVSGTIEANSTIQYPTFGIAGNIFDYDEVHSDITYPFAQVHSTLNLLNEVNSAYVLPTFAVDGTVEFILASGDLVFPKFAVDVNAATSRATGSLLYAVYAVNADANVPVGVLANYTAPRFAIDGTVNVPIGINGSYTLPKFFVEAVGGITNAVNADALYQSFKLSGVVQPTHSVDASLLYSKYVIEAFIGPEQKGNADIVYPKFGTAFVVDNYYGVALDADLTLTFEGEAENTKRRKTVSVFEH